MEDTEIIIIKINDLARRERFSSELLLAGYSVKYKHEKQGSYRSGVGYYVIAEKNQTK